MNLNKINTPLVSVCCTVYNQEKYVRKMLETLVNQKTTFSYEILIHDDASTDNTSLILKEYEDKYPNMIKVIYQSENQYSKNIPISFTYLYPIVKGKYVAFCEGDDYWSDENKLQKQVNILESNNNCSICINKVDIITENDCLTGNYFPRNKGIKEGIITSKDFLSQIIFTDTLFYLQFQLTGCMVKTSLLIDYVNEFPKFTKMWDVGDIPLMLYMGLHGDAFYIDKGMSCYRSGALGSWNNSNSSIEKKINHILIECAALEEFDNYSNYIVHESVVKGILNRNFGILRLKHDLKKMKSKEMKCIYALMPLKEKIIEHINYYVPNLYFTYKKIKNFFTH